MNFLSHSARIHFLFLKQKYPSIVLANRQHNEENLELLFNEGPNIKTTAKNNLPPLHLAVKAGRKTVVKLFLHHGAQVDHQDINGKTILCHAVENGESKMVEDILKYFPDNNNQSNRNSFKIAVHGYGKEYRKIVEALLKYGFTVEPEDINNLEFFHNAVEKGYLKIVEDLLKYGADVNIIYNFKFDEDFTPLHLAVHRGLVEMTKLLIKYGANVNSEDKTGKTPIFYATQGVNLIITELLIANGANVNAKLKNGITPLHLAVKNGDEKMVLMLLKYGAEINSKTEIGMIPFHLSIRGGHKKMITTLLNNGSNINAKLKDGTTALHIAAVIGRRNIVELLLKRGIEIDAKTKMDFKSLCRIVQNDCWTSFKNAMQFGANINSGNENGKTALHIASLQGHDKIVAILLAYGSDINITTSERFFNSNLYGWRISIWIRSRNSRNFFTIGSNIRLVEEILTCHAIKMKTANLYVNEENLKFTIENAKMNNIQKECEEEITKMKNEKINNSKISFYDILTKNTNSLAIYMKNKKIVQILTSNNYKKKFPLYSNMIRNNFKKAMERKELLENNYQIFHDLFNNFPEFPYDCIEKIFSYLSNNDLKILINGKN